MQAWGIAPGSGKEDLISAESAIHFRHQSDHHSGHASIASKVILHIIWLC
jgi:hypothetical protein